MREVCGDVLGVGRRVVRVAKTKILYTCMKLLKIFLKLKWIYSDYTKPLLY